MGGRARARTGENGHQVIFGLDLNHLSATKMESLGERSDYTHPLNIKNGQLGYLISSSRFDLLARHVMEENPNYTVLTQCLYGYKKTGSTNHYLIIIDRIEYWEHRGKIVTRVVND